MKTYDELVEAYGESEVAAVSFDFWLSKNTVITDMSDRSSIWDALLAYQNGWFMCKEKYKIND